MAKNGGLILTREVVFKIIEIMKPALEAILRTEGMTTDAKWVEGFVKIPNFNPIRFVLGTKTKWDKKWGPCLDFTSIAAAKLRVVLREKMSLVDVISRAPWLFKEEDYLYVGGVYENEIAITVSGAKSETDDGMARILLEAIKLFAQLEVRNRKEAGAYQI